MECAESLECADIVYMSSPLPRGFQRLLEASGSLWEASEASGKLLEASQKLLEAPGKPLEASGKLPEASQKLLEASKKACRAASQTHPKKRLKNSFVVSPDVSGQSKRF